MESEKNPTPPAAAGDKAAAEEVPGSPPPARAGTPPVRTETPAGVPPAARVAPGAAKASTTAAATTAKGIPAAAAKKQSPTTVVETAPDPPINRLRRRTVWAMVAGFTAVVGMSLARFFLPRTIMEPSSVFRIGFPGDYSLGVDTKWQQQFRIWVVKNSDRLFAIYARCTHLGCTPDWKSSENKFKCPCHGSGYDSEGINFEGPAPRPMDRAHIELDAEGQLVVDTNRLYSREKGKADLFNEEGAYIQV